MDYKKYSLENLENWLYDAMSAGEATPQEIYDVIVNVVKDEYYTYKKRTSEAYELLTLLNNNPFSEKVKELGKLWDKEDKVIFKTDGEDKTPNWNQDEILSCNRDDPSPECKGAWNDFWEDTDSSREYNLREAEYYNKRAELDTKEDKVVKWQLPVEVDGLSGECYVNLPDDLLEAANLKEGDAVKWVDNKNGTYTMVKTTEPLKMNEC